MAPFFAGVDKDKDQYCPAESGWRYAQDGKGMFVELHGAAHHTAVILKMAVPICVSKHDIGIAVRPLLIG